MSTIISHDMGLGLPSINIHAPSCNTFIVGTDIKNHLIQIDGEAKKPFIKSVRFVDCVIIAENLRAFESCYFDKSCTMKVKNMPIVNGCQSINCNFVIRNVKWAKVSKEVEIEITSTSFIESPRCKVGDRFVGVISDKKDWLVGCPYVTLSDIDAKKIGMIPGTAIGVGYHCRLIS